MLVRNADIFWSMSVMTNYNPKSPIKIPCSAYSMPAHLIHDVDYWDVDASGMAEDMHMFLKSYFATHGKLNVVSVYSPASHFDVQGNSYWSSVKDRVVQSSRHMWACSEIGYTLRRCIFGVFAPGFDMKNNKLIRASTISIQEHQTLSLSSVKSVIHRISEAHMFMGHVLLVTIMSVVLQNGYDMHPYVSYAMWVGGWVRFFHAPFVALQLSSYERYYQWNAVDKWEQQGKNGVFNLGKRSIMKSKKRGIKRYFEWALLPVVTLVFFVIPSIIASVKQLFTEFYDYKVASKPIISNSTEEMVEIIAHDTRKSVRGVDSGFFEFQPDDNQRNLAPGMWKAV
jgi:hypothetical protein